MEVSQKFVYPVGIRWKIEAPVNIKRRYWIHLSSLMFRASPCCINEFRRFEYIL